MTDFTNEILKMNFTGKPELSFGSPGWSNQGVSASGGQGMAIAAPIAAAGIQGLSTLIGGALGAGGKKKDRKHQMDMLKLQIAAAEKMQQSRWGKQDERMEGTRQALAPEQGFMPTYQSLRETNPMLQKFFGGQMSKLFGEDYQGMGDMFGRIAEPEYTGFEQEQAPLDKIAPKEAAPGRIPQYMRDRFMNRRGRGRGRGGGM